MLLRITYIHLFIFKIEVKKHFTQTKTIYFLCQITLAFTYNDFFKRFLRHSFDAYLEGLQISRTITKTWGS